MTDLSELSARLLALEAVVSQLITHMAVRHDDPSCWVETRRSLALHAVHDQVSPGDNAMLAGTLERAVSGLFAQVEHVAEEYALPLRSPRGDGTPRHFARSPQSRG